MRFLATTLTAAISDLDGGGKRMTRALSALVVGVGLLWSCQSALADKPIRSTDEFQIATVDGACGFPVEIAVHAFDEFGEFSRGGQLVRFSWHRTGTVTYTNLDTGDSLSGKIQRVLNRTIDNTGVTNSDGSTTYTDTDHGIRIKAVVPGVGTFRQVIGVTDLFITFSADGEVLDQGVVTRHGLNNPDLLSPRLCEALG